MGQFSALASNLAMGRLEGLLIGLALCARGSQAALQLPARFTGSHNSGSLDARSWGSSSSDSLGRRALWVRGGANKPAKGKAVKGKNLGAKKSAIKSVQEVLVQVKPATRFYMALSLFCTLVHMTGLPAPALFNLDMSRLWEIWRPLTAVAYLGAPSMSMANSIYFLVRYGQQLETLNGLGAHAWFLLVQTAILTFLGLLLGFPFTAQAMIAATVYVSSHLNPMERMPFQFGFVITSWQLPFAMMAIDCLSVRRGRLPRVLYCKSFAHHLSPPFPSPLPFPAPNLPTRSNKTPPQPGRTCSASSPGTRSTSSPSSGPRSAEGPGSTLQSGGSSGWAACRGATCSCLRARARRPRGSGKARARRGSWGRRSPRPPHELTLCEASGGGAIY